MGELCFHPPSLHMSDLLVHSNPPVYLQLYLPGMFVAAANVVAALIVVVVVVDVVVVAAVVDPRNLPLKVGQNWVSNS